MTRKLKTKKTSLLFSKRVRIQSQSLREPLKSLFKSMLLASLLNPELSFVVKHVLDCISCAFNRNHQLSLYKENQQRIRVFPLKIFIGFKLVSPT